MDQDEEAYRIDQRRQDELVIIAVVFTSLSILVVGTRTVVRAAMMRKFGADDWTMLGALLFSCAYLAEVIIMKYNGVGHAITTLSIDNMLILIKVTLAIQCTYYACVNCIKFSILFMYLRFAVTETLRYACFGLIGFHAMFFIISISVTLSQCQPIDKMWDLTGEAPGSCPVNTTAFFYFTSGFNILTDALIFTLPIKTLIAINRPRKEVYALIGVFCVGAFATVIAIIRLHTIIVYTTAVDPFRESILVNLWSVLEVNIGIMCASAPALKPLFNPQALREARYGSSGGHPKRTAYHYHSRDKSGTEIKSDIRVEQEFSARSINLGPIPSSSAQVVGGREQNSDQDSVDKILQDRY
ncbi:hypothetical protein QBC40DRAFT_230231 [Triangularia verruculosa]|uniref:Rhodopsin domain-containing protein n=1 Tax=Triangularia verruculosa TaxID=2587418 RepID=A0AAN7ARC4_9PEZI|nr:hypothetical protein QBC40DRAFT_230231 [Triangularia verruculosa]